MVQTADKRLSSNRQTGSAAAKMLAAGLVARLLRPMPTPPPLTEKQAEFVFAEANHAAFIGGIGSGKSFAGAERALRAAYGRVGEGVITTPNLGVITAPTYPMLEDATLRVFNEIAEPYIASFNISKMRMTMKNGSEILFRSTEKPDRLRGPSISWWFGDEAAMYDAKVRRVMLGRLRQFGQAGYEWLATTPRGRNWLYSAFVTNAKENYLLVRSSSAENTFLDRSIIEMWESEYTGDFAAQELGGEFVAFEGLIYAMFDRSRHVTTRTPGAFANVVAGVDWGFANPGVIVVVGIDGEGVGQVVAERYQRQTRIEEWVTVAQQMRAEWGIKTMYCDPASPDNIKKFVEGGLPAQAADNTVLTGIQAVQNRFATGRLLVASSCANVINEAEQYAWMENKAGVRDQPVKANDHAMDALRYAIMGIDHKRLKTLKSEVVRYA
jgi:PBSX family phage terminase large subunit